MMWSTATSLRRSRVVIRVGEDGLDVVDPSAITENNVVSGAAGNLVRTIPAEDDERRGRSCGVGFVVAGIEVERKRAILVGVEFDGDFVFTQASIDDGLGVEVGRSWIVCLEDLSLVG